MLNATIETLDGLSEEIQKLYKEQGDKFVLQVSGMQTDEDVNNLKTALVKERENVSAYSKLGSPDDIRKQIKELGDKIASGGKNDEDHEKIVAQLKQDYEQKLSDKDATVSNLMTRQASADFKAELAKLDVIPEGLDLLANFAQPRIQFNDDGTPKIMTSDGSAPMIGNGAGGGASLADLAAEVAKSMPSLVKDNGKGGGGKPPNSGGKPSTQTVTREQWDAMSHVDRSNHSKDGGKVVDS